MQRLTKKEWLDTGMTLLVVEGETGIRIDKLCKALDTSKVAFYQHFKNIKEYIMALLHYWEKQLTGNIITATETESEPESKGDKLNEMVLHSNHLLEVRLRAWGIQNKWVHDQLKKVDARRIQYLHNLYLEFGATNQEAMDLAKIDYAMFVGMQHLFRDLPLEDKQHLLAAYKQLLKAKKWVPPTKVPVS